MSKCVSARTGMCIIGAAIALGGAGCVVVTTPLAVDAGSDRSVALGSAVILHAVASGGAGDYQFVWAPVTGLNNPTIADPVFTPSSSGDRAFTVTVIDGRGDRATDVVLVHVSSPALPLTANAGPDFSAPVGLPTTLNGSATGGVGTYTFVWTPSTGLSNPNTAQPTVTPATPGVLTYTLTVTDAVGGTATDTVDVTAYTATTLTGLTWVANATAGYQLIATFSQPLDEATAETSGNYRDHASNAAAASAVLQPDNKSVLLTFTASPLSTSATFDIGAAPGIKDAAGKPVLSVVGRLPDANPADVTAPVLVSRKWGVNAASGYQVLVQFSEAIDAATAQNTSAYRLNGFVAPQTAILSGDGLTVTLTFAGVAVSTSATLDTGVGSALRDVNGQLLATVTGQPIAANAADITLPTISQALHAPQFTSAGYQIAVQFSEVMGASDVQTLTGYQVNGVTPTSAVLGTDGRTVTLLFATPVATADQITVGIGGTIRDINGNVLAQTSVPISPNSADTVGPQVLSRTWAANATSYQVLVTFNESLDKATATTTTNFVVSTPAGSANPNVAALDSTGKIVTLTMPAIAGGLRRTETLTATSAILDINRKANTTTSAVAIAANTADTTPPAIASAARVDAAHADVTFSEVMDKTTVEAATYTMTGGSVTAAVLQSDGRTVRLTTSVDPATQTVTVPVIVKDINGVSPASSLTTAPL